MSGEATKRPKNWNDVAFLACVIQSGEPYTEQVDAAVKRLQTLRAHAEAMAGTAARYHAAILASANDPETMASFCTAQGDTLDDLYGKWVDAVTRYLEWEKTNG